MNAKKGKWREHVEESMHQVQTNPRTRMFTKTGAFWSFGFTCLLLILLLYRDSGKQRTITTSIIRTMRGKMLVRACLAPQYSGVVLWHGRSPNKCYSSEVWEAMFAEEQADEIDAGTTKNGNPRAKYRVEKKIPLVRFERRSLYLAGVGETDVLASWKHWKQAQLLVGAYQNPLPRLTANGNVGSGVYYTGNPGSHSVTKRGLLVESSINEQKVGHYFDLDYARFKAQLGAAALQVDIRRSCHAAAETAEAR